MGDDEHRPLFGSKRVHARGHYLESVDVEPRIGLVEDGEGRLEHRHLENLIALLLAAGESFIDRAVDELFVELDELDFLAHELEKIYRVQIFFAPVFADGVEGRLQEVSVVHAGDLDRILKGKENTFTGALFGRHREQVLSFVEHFPFGDFEAVTSRQHLCQRALPRAVRSHDGVHFARLNRQIDAVKDLAPFGIRVQVLDLDQFRHLCLSNASFQTDTQ